MSVVSSDAPSTRQRPKRARADPLVVSRDAHRDRRAGMVNFFAYIHFIGFIFIQDMALLPGSMAAALSRSPIWEVFRSDKRTSIALFSTIIVWDFLSIVYFSHHLITRRRHTQSVRLNLVFLSVITFGSLIIHAVTLKIFLDQDGVVMVVLVCGFAFFKVLFLIFFIIFIIVYTARYHGYEGFRRPFAVGVGQPGLASLPKGARRGTRARIARAIFCFWCVAMGLMLTVINIVILVLVDELPRITWIILVCAPFQTAGIYTMVHLAYTRRKTCLAHVCIDVVVLLLNIGWTTASLLTWIKINPVDIAGIVPKLYYVNLGVLSFTCLYELLYTGIAHPRTGWFRPFAATTYYEDDVVEMADVFKEAERNPKSREEDVECMVEPRVEPFTPSEFKPRHDEAELAMIENSGAYLEAISSRRSCSPHTTASKSQPTESTWLSARTRSTISQPAPRGKVNIQTSPADIDATPSYAEAHELAPAYSPPDAGPSSATLPRYTNRSAGLGHANLRGEPRGDPQGIFDRVLSSNLFTKSRGSRGKGKQAELEEVEAIAQQVESHRSNLESKPSTKEGIVYAPGLFTTGISRGKEKQAELQDVEGIAQQCGWQSSELAPALSKEEMEYAQVAHIAEDISASSGRPPSLTKEEMEHAQVSHIAEDITPDSSHTRRLTKKEMEYAVDNLGR